VYLLPLGIFIYFLIGAIDGQISLIPIRGNEGLEIYGTSAWISCLSPLLWLMAEVVQHDPSLGDRSKKKNFVSFLIYLAAIAFFFYSITFPS